MVIFIQATQTDSIKKRSQEKSRNWEDTEQRLIMIEEQMGSLSITTSQHYTNQTVSLSKTVEKELAEEKMDIETEPKEEPNSKGIKEAFLAGTIEQSQWSSENRICNKNKFFKANMPTYALPGETKEEKVKYVKWI